MNVMLRFLYIRVAVLWETDNQRKILNENILVQQHSNPRYILLYLWGVKTVYIWFLSLKGIHILRGRWQYLTNSDFSSLMKYYLLPPFMNIAHHTGRNYWMELTILDYKIPMPWMRTREQRTSKQTCSCFHTLVCSGTIDAIACFIIYLILSHHNV